MSEIVVALGPTLSHADARRILPEATIVPPMKAGDLKRSSAHAKVVVVVDGLFEQVPSIWHKEVLHALSRGVWVYGASSMGALRAAELDRFGMVGIGKIFEAFRDGVLEDDDEVAVCHGAAADAFRPLSEAMVNLRFGLATAAERGIVSAATRDRLIEAAKRLFYPDRAWKPLFADAIALGVPEEEVARLRAFVETERPNQKRADAIAVLERVAADLRGGLGAFVPDFTFEATSFWERAFR